MFGPNGEKVMTDLRGLYYEEFHDLYSSSKFVGWSTRERCDGWGI
jgi:hypothetical protein